MRIAIIIIAALALASCEGHQYPEWAVDQSIRQKLFKQCMELLPAGPQSTKYNDWDEVVEQCDTEAYYQARFCVENCPKGVQTQPFITPNT